MNDGFCCGGGGGEFSPALRDPPGATHKHWPAMKLGFYISRFSGIPQKLLSDCTGPSLVARQDRISGTGCLAHGNKKEKVEGNSPRPHKTKTAGGCTHPTNRTPPRPPTTEPSVFGRFRYSKQIRRAIRSAKERRTRDSATAKLNEAAHWWEIARAEDDRSKKPDRTGTAEDDGPQGGGNNYYRH